MTAWPLPRRIIAPVDREREGPGGEKAAEQRRPEAEVPNLSLSGRGRARQNVTTL